MLLPQIENNAFDISKQFADNMIIFMSTPPPKKLAQPQTVMIYKYYYWIWGFKEKKKVHKLFIYSCISTTGTSG